MVGLLPLPATMMSPGLHQAGGCHQGKIARTLITPRTSRSALCLARRQKRGVCRAEKDQQPNDAPKQKRADAKINPKHLVSFYIPVATPTTSDDEVLKCPDIRAKLTPRESPFVVHNVWGGGFVNDKDRVALNSMYYAQCDSSGATSMCFYVPPEELKASSQIRAPDNGPGADGSGATGGSKAWEPSSIFKISSSEESDVDRECIPLPPFALRAGARRTVYFEPKKVTAAIVTCGGLCPGLNDVVQGMVRRLIDYGVPEDNILGIRNGFRGFYQANLKPMVLNNAAVNGIHFRGGTILGTSRGGADMSTIVDRIELWNVDMVFVIGGDGGNKGARAISELCEKRGINCCVIGVPKSIDNDILLIDKTFGFETAVDEAQRALMAAKVEASSAYNGIGLVKLMGRQSGFIAMQAALASGVVDVCLIPEVDFQVEGPKGVLAYVESTVMARQGHAVICVAEGAGQALMEVEAANGQPKTDASGNPVLKDIGQYMKSKIKAGIKDADVKLIDPTYMVRAIPSNSADHIYCKILAQGAVDAAFAGYTGVCVGMVNTHFVLLPIDIITQAPRRVDPSGKMWNRLRASIDQPNFPPMDDEPAVIPLHATAQVTHQ